MSESPARLVARHVHDLIDRQRLDALPDHALLRRFLDGDEPAFAALVRRHGPLVLGTCRRILRQFQDAEDACQAVFLVLARKGGTVRGGDSLAGWLHRVAVRAASRLRRLRRAAEPLPKEIHAPEPAGDELVWREVRNTFDTEVGRLPERLRLPLVLCCLLGKTRTEAAADLGWSEGTVRGRLERGRKLLRSRFTRKGLTLPAAFLPLLIEDVAPGAAPAALASPSTAAARLADAVVRSMVVARAKLAAWATAAVLVAGTAVGLGVYGPAAAQPKAGEAPAATPAAPPVTAADAERNLDTFVLRVSLAPAGEGKFDPKYSLYHVLLYVPNLRLEPPANGPDGKPTEAHARITKEQAKKMVDALTKFDFFKDDSAFHDPWTRKLEPTSAGNWPHAGIGIRFQNGEDTVRQERLLAWLPKMLQPLDAIRGCVNGDAAKALDQLLAQLADDRKRWGPDPLAEDFKRLQGSWIAEVPGDRLRVDVVTNRMAKCVIDGKSIVLKPQVQRNPLLDLETIRGTFELSGGWWPKMTIKGTRDTVSKQEPGTWTALYQVTGTTLKLLLAPAGDSPLPEWKPRKDKGDREFTFHRVETAPASDWGEASSGVRMRIHASKAKYTAGEVPSFDLDVRDTHPGIAGKPWHWQAARLGELARVEVDGVWYRVPPKDYWKVISHELALGQTVEKWVAVSLADKAWATEATAEMPARPLVLKPGKHRVRVKYDFSPSEGGIVPASPVSGPVEIEILPEKAIGHASDWGQPSKGVSARIRTKKAKFATGETIKVDLDVKAAGDGGRELSVWTASRTSSPARLEVGGVWYKRVPDEESKNLAAKLTAGEQVDGWSTLNLSDHWVVEYYTGIPPGQAGQRLELPAGTHKLRVGFSFSNQTASATPVSGPLEVEILSGTGKAAPPAAGPWRAKATWHPHGPDGVRYLGVAPDDRHLYTADKDGVILWDLSGPEPKADQKVGYTMDGLQFAGLDRDGLPLLLRQTIRPQPNEGRTDLTVLRLPDMGDNVKPQLAVPTDSLREWAVRPDGKALAIGSAWWESIRLVDLPTGKDRKLESPKGERGRLAFLHRLLFSRDGKTLIGLGSNDYPVTGWKNGLVVCWDATSGKVVWQAEEPKGQGTGALSAEGRTLVTGGRLGRLATVWDTATGTKLREIPTDGVEAIGVSRDGKTVVIGTYTEGAAREPILEIWDLTGKTEGQRLSVPTKIRFVSVRDDGRAFAAADVNGAVGWWVREK